MLIWDHQNLILKPHHHQNINDTDVAGTDGYVFYQQHILSASTITIKNTTQFPFMGNGIINITTPTTYYII